MFIAITGTFFSVAAAIIFNFLAYNILIEMFFEMTLFRKCKNLGRFIVISFLVPTNILAVCKLIQMWMEIL